MTNFHRNTNSDRRSTRVKHHAKASSAGSTDGSGLLGSVFGRRSAAMPAVSRGSKGSSAPAAKLLGLLAIALVALFATAAPASAAPLAAKMETITNVSYASAHVTGKVSSPCKGLCGTTYTFQYATSESGPWNSGPGGFISGLFEPEIENKPVEGNLEGLKGSTEYFVRLVVSYEGEAIDPSAPPYPSFTTLPVDPPTIPGAVEASPVFSTSAKVSGKVKRPANADAAFDVNCHFEYISDAQFLANEGNGDPGFTGAEPVPCVENPVTKDSVDGEGEQAVKGEQAVTASLTGLSPATAYHLRLVAENAAPGVVVKDGTFTTAAKVAKPIVIATDDATDPTIHEAKVSGVVQRPAGIDPALDVNCRFEYVTQGQFEAEEFTAAELNGQVVGCIENPIAEATVGAEGKQAVSAELTGLKPETTYHLRLAASNEGGVDAKEAANTFTTLEAEKPIVTIDPVAGGTYTTAHVSGTVDVDDPGRTSQYLAAFEVSTDGGASWDNFISAVNKGAFATIEHPGPNVVEHDFTGLQPNTPYTFRIASTYESGDPKLAEANGEVAYSLAETITTEPLTPPTADDLAVTDVTATSAHLSATVNPNAPAGPLPELTKKAFATHWEFVCVPECKNANGNTIEGTVQGEGGTQTVAGDAKRLEPGTPYEVSLIISSEGGTETKVEAFPTLETPPTVKQTPGASDGKGGYTLQGVVNPNNNPITGCEFKWGPDAPAYAFSAPCSPTPSGGGRDEVQSISVKNADGGQFKLTYRGQSTADLPFDASAAEVQAALEALPAIGTGSVALTGNWTVTFQGALGHSNAAQISIQNGTVPLSLSDHSGGNSPSKSTNTVIDGSGNVLPITVEAHLTGLNPGVVYHALLVVTYGAGSEAKGVDQEFKATLADKETCPNEQLRTENSSLALPECRAYEKVTPSGKEGYAGVLFDYSGGDRVLYNSLAGNIAKSGQNGTLGNFYVAARTVAGWETIPNLNGSSGSIRDAPSYVTSVTPLPEAYSKDLLSSLWSINRIGGPAEKPFQFRNPDGSFTEIGPPATNTNVGSPEVMPSADLSHFVVWRKTGGIGDISWGTGLYEYVGIGVAEPRRVDVDNTATNITNCPYPTQGRVPGTTRGKSISRDGRVIVFSVAGGCGGANPPADEVWARVNGTTSFEVSASQCNRVDCNAPADATFQAATPDGSRVFFTTKQQLLDADTDETNDLYACDIPSGTPAPVIKANPCSALRQVSAGDPAGAAVESVGTTSENGATVLFTAKGVLAENKDALKEKAVTGDHNLYLWRADSSHPDGQTAFVGRLDSDDLVDPSGTVPQATPDGRYVVFTTASQLLDTDTDNARDAYRYDAETGELTRVSTNVSGVAGNGPFDVQIARVTEHHPTTTISDDGTKIIFTTTESLNLAIDNNDEPDVYLWTPSRVSLISTGSAPSDELGNVVTPNVAIDSLGEDIYFESAQQLTSADGDDSTDIYDARIGGGFSFASNPCVGENCQPDPTPPSPNPPSPANQPDGDGNVKSPKSCPKGKVRNKKGKCVKKHTKGQTHKKQSKKHPGKKASHKQGGGK
jgi:hypothetical protein